MGSLASVEAHCQVGFEISEMVLREKGQVARWREGRLRSGHTYS